MPGGRRTNWLSKPFPQSQTAPSAWLRDRGSLTKRLQTKGAFSVHLITQGLSLPTDDEAFLLGLPPRKRVWVREVELYCNGKALVFAHTIMPCRPRGPLNRWFARLGNRSLGALLFTHPGFQRGELGYTAIDRHHPLFAHAASTLYPEGLPLGHSAKLWARRSRFVYKTQTILVTEIYSPAIASI
ncbi:chorismate--pyruvate lyase family protein [Propionivibrio limicola]|uniref:chorismate--pyruvate lyase family protein n=1 Tax=Propionivibrio limicola TaxID=167645 RepID=UPI001290D5F8|nr:chorismate lyase [Propionivibrio limicola]